MNVNMNYMVMKNMNMNTNIEYECGNNDMNITESNTATSQLPASPPYDMQVQLQIYTNQV